MRLALLASLALAAPLVAGCDFTPTLDIELPEHEPAVVISAVLAADSVAVVRLGVSRDPYVFQSYRYGPPPTREDAVVTLLRDGVPVERLRIRPFECQGDFDPSTGAAETYECGPYVGAVPVQAGGTYSVRAEVPGLPAAEGTATVPRRPALDVTEVDRVDGRRAFRVRVADPAGRGDRYGVALINGPYQGVQTECDYRTDPPTCTDRTVTYRAPDRFTSSDPVILAAARDVEFGDASYRFVSVTDNSFDGQTWDFTIRRVGGYEYAYPSDNTLTVQVAALSGDVYDAYQIASFGGQGDENPFVEPVNVPSNVVGGYGLVGAVALAEVTFAGPEPVR